MYSVVDDDDSDGNDTVGNAQESIAEETSNVALPASKKKSKPLPR